MSYFNGPRIVTNGLVLYLDAANSKSYPGSGNTWYDLSSYNYTGTINGTLSYNNKYFTFNDTQYVSTLATPVSLQIYDANYTCEAIASFSNLSGDNMIFGNVAQTARAGWHLGTRNTSFYFGHYGSDTSAGTATINTIYHITWTFEKGVSSNSAKIWINGSNISGVGGNIGSYIATNNVLIGTGFDTSSTRFAGNLYYAKVYKRVLEPYEILQNYNALKGRFAL